MSFIGRSFDVNAFFTEYVNVVFVIVLYFMDMGKILNKLLNLKLNLLLINFHYLCSAGL